MKHHCTEAALVELQDDIHVLPGMKKREVAALVLLGVSGAFDTINHRMFWTG